MAMDINVEEKLEFLAKLPRGVRLGAVLAILLGFAAAYYYLFYVDLHAQVASLRAQNDDLQRRLTKVRVVSNNLAEFEQEVADLERELTLALKQLPNRKQFEDLLQDITTAGKKVGVQIKSIERVDEIEHGFYAEVPFQLELEGTFHNVAMFFERVAKLPRIVNIGAMNINVSKEDENGTTLRVQGQATTFRFLPG
jgi:type IV pilus assembly protein PilO